MKKGFTLIEVLISIAILALITAVILGIFRLFDENRALSSATAGVISVIEKARQLTLFSKDSSQYGVHFDTNEVVIFKGDTFSAMDVNNITTKLHSKIFIEDISLNGGAPDLIFERLSGETEEYGTITIQSKADSSKTKVLIIEKTGLVR